MSLLDMSLRKMFKLITMAATQIMFANELMLYDMINKGYKRISLKENFTIQLIGKKIFKQCAPTLFTWSLQDDNLEEFFSSELRLSSCKIGCYRLFVRRRFGWMTGTKKHRTFHQETRIGVQKKKRHCHVTGDDDGCWTSCLLHGEPHITKPHVIFKANIQFH